MTQRDFLTLNADERASVFESASQKTGQPTNIVEKDFWLCWVLAHLFTLKDVPPMVFKGGTSLSKVYGVIRRFSEDLDITIDNSGWGLSRGELDVLSVKKRKATLLSVTQARLPRVIEDLIVPQLQARSSEVSVSYDGNETVEVRYPSLGAAQGYVRPVVRLEFGGRNPITPNEAREITPLAANYFPSVAFPRARILVLKPVRTFWEKATILHALIQKGNLQNSAERQSRHWYDLFHLSRHDIGKEALQNLDMLTAVAEDKELYYYDAGARYSKARPGTLVLVPAVDQRAPLNADYAKMVEAGMFFEEPPTMDDILSGLQEVQSFVNKPT